MALYDDFLAVVENLKEALKRWERLSRIIGWEGVEPRISGNFYKAVVQVTLLFGEENWVM